jgi:acyl carrier protein
MNLEETIRSEISSVLKSSGQQLSEPLTHDTILLRSGLDSLGFAILVARLEEVLGFDPFLLMKDPVYPQTFGDFVEIYERLKPTE